MLNRGLRGGRRLPLDFGPRLFSSSANGRDSLADDDYSF
jgi:hypothetical protein